MCFYKLTFLYKIKLHCKFYMRQFFFFMNWADWCFLKYFSTDLQQKTPLSFPTMPSGNYRRFSLFQEWSACIKHGDAPVLTLSGAARDSLSRPDQLRPRWSSQTFLMIKYRDYYPWIHLQNGHSMKSLVAAETHACTVSLNSDSGQGLVSILETVHVSMEIYQFPVPWPWRKLVRCS